MKIVYNCLNKFNPMKKIILLLLILFVMPFVFAKDITMTVNQTEYYFLVGEDAVIPIEMENTYKKPIQGMFEYSIAQEINQGGIQYSSSNTESKSYSVEEGKHNLNFGITSSNQPSTLKADFSFNYEEKGQRIVELDGILIHFVSDQSQKQNQENQKTSKSEEVKQQSKEEQKSIAQQMQEQLEKMFQQQPSQPSAQQRVQNNQMPQDSSALKEQMQKQMQEQQKLREEFEKNLADNPEFQQKHEEILQQGFELKGENLDPVTNNTGSFELNYEKGSETASLKGEMKNGTIENIQKSSSEDLRKIMEKLGQNEQFQKYDSELKNENFTQQLPEINQIGNKTQVKIQYKNENNETAAITAMIENDEVKEVKLERKRLKWRLWLMIALLMAVFAYLVYKKYFKVEEIEEKKPKERPINYKKEALKILEEAKKLFSSEKFKDAYGKAAKGIRFYYSYKLGLKREMTNTDLIKYLKKNKVSYQKTQKCLNLCSLVEFAKYTANKKDFDEIVKLAEKVIV